MSQHSVTLLVTEYCDEHVVCLSVREHISRAALAIITIMLPMSVARSTSGGVAICYVLPVLWIPSCLHILARIGDAKRRAFKVTAANRGWSLIFTIALLVMCIVQRHFTSTSFILIGCRRNELGHILREFQFGQCERSFWFARAQNSSSVQFSSLRVI